MVIVKIVSIISILSVGIITSISDIKNHKAYNKDLLVFACVGLAIQILSISIGNCDAITSLVNVCLAFLTAFFFFVARIWAAGDAKLFTVIILLIPRNLYGSNAENIFPAFMVLGFIFTFALMYVIVESVVLFIKDVRKGVLGNWKRFLPQPSIRALLAWVLGYVSVSTLNVCLRQIDSAGVWQNSGISAIISLLFVTAVFSIFETTKSQLVFLCVCVVVRVLFYVLYSIAWIELSITALCAVALIILVRSFTGQYNYRTIPTASVRTGQILARQSLLFMIPSTVRGLPKWTDESTRCRLDHEEVAAIKRWEHSKYGQSEITIVRHIPFAPFIFSGTLVYLVMAFYLGV